MYIAPEPNAPSVYANQLKRGNAALNSSENASSATLQKDIIYDKISYNQSPATMGDRTMLDFMGVSNQLNQAGNRLTQHATVTRNGLSHGTSSDNSLLHVVDVMTEPHTYLSLEAHRLDFGAYCVQAVLTLEKERELQAVWMLHESMPVLGLPGERCCYCLMEHIAPETCPLEDSVPTEIVRVLDLANTLVAWMRKQFDADQGFQKRVALN